MKLLITTQAVDLDDPALGFFHRWIEEISKQCDAVEVICLKGGRYNFPENVHVHSLGKERDSWHLTVGIWQKNRQRLTYTFRFYRYIVSLRNKHDAVFVHMNSEYVCLGGFFWRLWGKRIVLWRNHKMSGFSTWLAVKFAHRVCYTSATSYVAKFSNAVRMPIGIDTERFTIGEAKPPHGSMLFLGRIDKVKNPLVFLDALERLREAHIDFHADVYGAPTYPDDPQFGIFLERAKLLQDLKLLSYLGPIANEKTPPIYASHEVYINLTPSGSFDKTIGEAMACGCIPIVSNDALRGSIPEQLLVAPRGQDVVSAVLHVRSFSNEEREQLRRASRDYIVLEHSLALLVQKLIPILRGTS
ncbi:MAG TPA: glycosyltransferase family 4 protein [Candidatus Paceibacterota bacterium]|nr:glycosyltransferase family 4 protein [Candidatus Paceibacterota bacterium]